MEPRHQRTRLLVSLLLGGMIFPAGAGLAQISRSSALIATPSISADAALTIALEAMRAARERQCQEAVAVVDQGGTLLVLLRSDGASQQFVEGAGQKAWTALNLRASTRDVLATIQKGEQDDGQLPFIPKALFLMGGVPLEAGEAVVGGVGAAGCVTGIDHAAAGSLASPGQASASTPPPPPVAAGGNPINSVQFLGTGELGRLLGLPADGALRIGGVGVINATGQWQGGSPGGADSAGGFLAIGASLDLEKAIGWKGAKLAVAGLQYNVEPTNANAGSLQGIVSSDAAGPNNRTELYNYLFVQNLFDDQLQFIAGKLIPTIAFGNAAAPDPLAQSGSDWVPTLTSLLYTPVFVVPTMLGRIPGYPDSALGFGFTVAPDALPGTYLSGGVFDGRLGANNTPTGLVAPSLSGPLFSIAQAGTFWRLGPEGKPGQFFLGAWNQGGPLQAGAVSEASAWGLYGQVSQRLSHFRFGRDSSGLNVFLQAGWSPSSTNLIHSSIGGGITMWAPFANRPKDSYGLGLSWAAPNSDPVAAFGFNGSELILQAYAQLHVVGGIFLQPTLSLLPRVGLPDASPPSVSGTLQLTALF